MTTKPREYWLHLSGDDKQWYVADHVGSHDFDLHVIEAAPLLAKIARLELERDAYATAMKIALENGIFATKETTSQKIKKTLDAILKPEQE